MDPFSVYELTTTALKLSWQIYEYFEAVRSAPEEVKKYLEALQSIRSTLSEVRSYAATLKDSQTYQRGSSDLSALETVLRECYATFELQVKTIEKYKTTEEMSTMRKLRKQVAFIWEEDAIKQTILKMEQSQQILLICLAASTGRTTVGISDNVLAIKTDIQGVTASLKAEEDERIKFRQYLDKFTETMINEIGLRSRYAHDFSTQSSTRLSDLVHTSDSLAGAVLADQNDDAVDMTPVPSLDTIESSTEEAIQPDYSSTAAAREASERFSLDFLKDTPPVRKGESLVNDSRADHTFKHLRTSERRWYRRNVPKAMSAESNLMKSLGSDVKFSVLEYLMSMAAGQSGPLSLLKTLTLVLTEVQDTVQIADRELQLGRSPAMYQLVVEVYASLFEILQECYLLSTKSTTASFRIRATQNLNEIEEPMKKLRVLTEKILREADYRHRLELHKASNKINQIHVEQQKMLRMLDDQKRLLESMREERQIMDVVRNQQKVLQILMQIQSGMAIDQTLRKTVPRGSPETTNVRDTALVTTNRSSA